MWCFPYIITPNYTGDDGRKEKKKKLERLRFFVVFFKTEYLSQTAVKSSELLRDRHDDANARHRCFITQGNNETHLDAGNNALLCLAKWEPKFQFCMCLYLEK